MQRLCGEVDLISSNNTGNANRRGRDHLDVDVVVGKGFEHRGGYAGIALHAGTDQGHATDIVIGEDNTLRRGKLTLGDLADSGGLLAGNRERDVGDPSADTFCTIMSTLTPARRAPGTAWRQSRVGRALPHGDLRLGRVGD